MIKIPRSPWILLPALLAALTARAAVQLPAIFGDHMVLQQGVDLPFWGKASPGEKVTVSVAGSRGESVADAGGKWKVALPHLKVTGQPVTVEVRGTNTITFTDVLIGDVWLCSGQSNMEFGLGLAHNAAQKIPEASHPQLRLFLVQKAATLTPQADCAGTWMVCTPESVIKIGGWNGFSAVGYFFGTEIQADRKIPIGLVGSYWGGTPAQAWTSLPALQADAALAAHVKKFETNRDNLAALKTKYTDEELPKWQEAVDAWKKLPDPKAHQPWRPNDPEHNPSLAATLFNGMINPIVGYGIKGAIWYQGEANGGSAASAKDYQRLFPAMISDWRQRWALGDFPFLFVQLANFTTDSAWPELRNAQLKTLSLPNTGMAVAIDVGNPTDIHPTDKEDVGHRLALAARHVAYGEKLVYSGPIYESMKTKGNQVVLRFKNTGGGLAILASPPLKVGEKPAEPAASLQSFEIAGADKKFVPAQATIKNKTVVVWNDQVPNPVAVRYGWSNFPQPAANLYNREGLPASPFTTEVE